MFLGTWVSLKKHCKWKRFFLWHPAGEREVQQNDFKLTVISHRYCFGFDFLGYVISPENSRHFHNQSDKKNLNKSCVLIGSLYRLPIIWLVVVITLVLALRHSIEIRSKRLGIVRFPPICKFSLTVFFYFKLYWGILSVLWDKIAYISTIENKHQPSYF